MAFGSYPVEAKANAEAAFGAVADRFTNVLRTPKFAAARPRLARHALTPSRLWGDTAIWTSSGRDSSRTLLVGGGLDGGRYVFDARPLVPLPVRPGDSRHHVRLKSLGDGEFEWDTDVDHGIGQVRADEVAAVLSTLLSAPAGRSEGELRAEYRATFPRTTAALGRLLSLDTLRSSPQPDGSSAVVLGYSLHPERLKRSFPAFAAYVDKYLGPARIRATLSDRQGADWLDVVLDDSRLTLRLRSRDGALVPLSGPARAMPDTLQLRAELFAKVMIFTVGVSDLVADWTFVRSEHERGWLLRFQRSPSWHLPLAVKHLIGAPLRRPFEHGGTMMRVTILDRPGAQTLLTRRFHVPVQESAILRWLNKLGFTAASDFAGASEVEENRFIAEAFNAMRADVRALPLKVGAEGVAP